MRWLPEGFFRRDLVVYNSDLEFEAPLLLLGTPEVLNLPPSTELELSSGRGDRKGDKVPVLGWGHCKEPSQGERQEKMNTFESVRGQINACGQANN